MSKSKPITGAALTREEALAICPDYVAFVEGNFGMFRTVYNNFRKAKRGMDCITGHKVGDRVQFIRAKVSSVTEGYEDNVVRVSNGEYAWRVDGCDYAWMLPLAKHLR